MFVSTILLIYLLIGFSEDLKDQFSEISQQIHGKQQNDEYKIHH